MEEAVGYTLASLVFYLQVGAPEASLCLSWLARQQEQLGETQFRTVVHRHLGEQETENLLQLLEQKRNRRVSSKETWSRIPPIRFALDVSLGCLTERNDDADVSKLREWHGSLDPHSTSIKLQEGP